jgi:hypothetical protein
MSERKLLLKKDLVAFIKYNGKESLTLDLGEVYKWKIYNDLCVIYEQKDSKFYCVNDIAAIYVKWFYEYEAGKNSMCSDIVDDVENNLLKASCIDKVEEVCENCRFAKEIGFRIEGYTLTFCHKKSPGIFPVDSKAQWPIVNEDDFCGEFEVRT